MITPKHTPGPWAINRNDTGMNDSGTIEGNGIVICPDIYGESLERVNANAALIAAAPAMYEALKALQSILKPDAPGYAQSTQCQQVEAALAQAEGKL